MPEMRAWQLRSTKLAYESSPRKPIFAIAEPNPSRYHAARCPLSTKGKTALR